LSKPSLLQSAIAGVGGLWRRRSGYTDAADLNSSDPERRGQGLFRRGRSRMRAGQAEDAVADFDQALGLLPDYAEAVAARAESLDMIGKSEAALPEYQRARRLWAAEHPGAPDRRYVLRRPGRYTFEVDSYELALRRVKTGSFPHLASGNAFLAQGQADEALRCYERALRLKPKDPNLIALKGEALSLMGHYSDAIAAFDTALAANPKDLESLNARGIAQIALDRLDEANADWRRQLELLPAEQAAARACVALRLADYATALGELERAVAREPKNPYWKLYRLTALRRLGKTSGGIETSSAKDWPGPLIALHAGKATAEEVLARVDTEGRRAEAAFQLGVLGLAADRAAAAKHWKEVVERGAPALIEYAAARNELSRLG
jgi:tetratricopeptide (TPR) repeat protein